MKWKQFTGQVSSHIDPESGLHKDIGQNILTLKKSALKKGIDLQVISGFRSFEKQKEIWSDKALGKRTILDDQSQVVPLDDLSEWEICQAILRFSALPGLSRHHWGTDFDVYDKTALPEGYSVKLIPLEYDEGEVFSELGHWLEKKLPYEGFENPYAEDTGGVHPEPWHISYKPLADEYRQRWDSDRYQEFLKANPFPLSETILENFDDVIERFWI